MNRRSRLELRRLPNLPELVDAMNVPSRGDHLKSLKSDIFKDSLNWNGLSK
jgi:hypothetical protein